MTGHPGPRTFGRWAVAATGRVFPQGTEVEVRLQDGRVLVASASFTQVFVTPHARAGDDARSLSIVSDEQSVALLPLGGQNPEDVAREVNAAPRSVSGASMSAPRPDWPPRPAGTEMGSEVVAIGAGQIKGCLLIGTAFANTLVVGFLVFLAMMAHFDCAPQCDNSVDWIVGSGYCVTCERRPVSPEDWLIPALFFLTGVIWGWAGLGGWRGAAAAALGQPSFIAILLFAVALVRTVQGEPLALVAAIGLISLPSIAGWAASRLVVDRRARAPT